MDRNQALNILGLPLRPYQDEVRAALRALAKEHHPDFWAHDSDLALREEEKMKQINVAYGILEPMIHTFPLRPSTPFFLENFLNWFGRCLKGIARWGRESSRRSEPEPPLPRAAKGPVKRSGVPRGGPAFRDVLDPLCPGNGGRGERPRGQRVSAWDNYSRHMALKRRVKQRKRAGEDRGPVERVTRVRGVSPISRD